MRFLPALLLSLAAAAAAEPIDLFDGKTLTGWQAPTGTWRVEQDVVLDPANPKAFFAKPGNGTLVNSTGGKTVNLLTEKEFGDCELHVEFNVAKASNSGVYLMGRYEIQVFDSFGKATVGVHDCAAIYERWDDATKKGFEGTAPKVNASKAPGEWQTFDITFRAPRFDAAGKKTENARFIKVVHNGQVVHENVELTGPTRGPKFKQEGPTGPILLQGDHGPVAYRAVKITPLSQP